MNNDDMRTLSMCNNIYFRGYDSQYGVFNSHNKLSYTWITSDSEYALEYAVDKVAIIDIGSACLGSILDLEESADIYEPTEEDMDSLYQKGYDGYEFDANRGNSPCICIKKEKLHLLCNLPKNLFSKYFV